MSRVKPFIHHNTGITTTTCTYKTHNRTFLLNCFEALVLLFVLICYIMDPPLFVVKLILKYFSKSKKELDKSVQQVDLM